MYFFVPLVAYATRSSFSQQIKFHRTHARKMDRMTTRIEVAVLQVEAARRAYVVPELLAFPDEKLDEPLVFGHPLAATKLDAIYLCARHESLHAGQIAMIRRSVGKVPLR